MNTTSTDNLQQAIAKAVAEARQRHPSLTKSDATQAYRSYRQHFAEREDDPPTDSDPARDELLLAIWDVIVDRETDGADAPDGDLDDFYVQAFDGLLGKRRAVPPANQPLAVTPELPQPTTAPHPPRTDAERAPETATPMDDEATGPAESIFRLLITLDGSNPKITRTLLVSKFTSQPRLHHIIQAAMGWRGTEQFQFYPASELGLSGSADTELHEMFSAPGKHCGYEFDHWYHDIELDRVERPEGRRHYPVCVAGQRACPPEDVGGIGDYNKLIRTLDQPDHPDYAEMAGWLTQDFHPAAFNIDQANLRLSQYQEDDFQAVV